MHSTVHKDRKGSVTSLNAHSRNANASGLSVQGTTPPRKLSNNHGTHGTIGPSSKSKPNKRSRLKLKRRVAETAITEKQYRDPRASLSTFLVSNKHKQASLGPSINPVRRSFEATPDDLTTDFVTHYHRDLHSHMTIDSRHEMYYKHHGFPSKPSYNKKGRRFTDSSGTDEDYDIDGFKKEMVLLNARASVEDDMYEYGDDDDDDDDEDGISREGSRNRIRRINKVYPAGGEDGSSGNILMLINLGGCVAVVVSQLL